MRTNGLMLSRVALLATTIMFPVTAFAQPIVAKASAASTPAPGQPTVGADTSGGEIAEVIVTAQRRAESSQRAAVAIAVVSPDDIQRAQITSARELNKLVPALQASSSGGTSVTFYLRGVGTATASPTANSSVAVNLDGIYLGRPEATSGYFYDLARVEVLKGPQGTLYGRNATGGAVNIIPQTPKIGENSGYVNAAAGNYAAINFEGAANIAVGENSAIRISGNYAKRDGFLSDGSSDLDTRSIRAQFLTNISPDLHVRLSADYTERFGEGMGGTIVALTPYNPVTGAYTITPSGLGLNVGAYDPRTNAIIANTFSPIAGRNLEPFALRSKLDGKFWGVNAEVNWTTGIGTFTLVPAYRRNKIQDVTNGGAFPYNEDRDARQGSVELRLAGDAGPTSYILGSYYFDEDIKNNSIPYNQVLTPYQNFSATTKSLAAFGRLTYKVSDTFRLVGGLRYTRDRNNINGASTNLLSVCVAPTGLCPGAPLLPYTKDPQSAIAQLGLVQVAPGTYILPTNPAAANTLYLLSTTTRRDRRTDGKLTYRAAVEFDVAPQSLLYASFENGFRSGGFSFSNFRPSFAPETIQAWTLGSKNRWLDNRLQLNVEAFWWNYEHQQVGHAGTELDGSPNYFVENIGKSTNKGVEVDGQFLLTRDILLGMTAQYLDAKYDQFLYQVPASSKPLTSCTVSGPVGSSYNVDCSGKSALLSPEWIVSLMAQKTLHLGENRLILNAGTTYQSSIMTGFEQLDIERQAGYWRSNAEVTFVTSDERLSVSAFVNNIENKRVLQTSGYFSTYSNVNGNASDPRTYGIRVGSRF